MGKQSESVGYKTTPEEYQILKAEGDVIGVPLATYIRSVMDGRHEGVFNLPANAEKIKTRYEAIIERLEQERADLLDRLSRNQKETGLAGLDAKKGQFQIKEQDIETRITERFERKSQDKELVELRAQCTKLGDEVAELQCKVEEYESEESTQKRVSGYLEMATKSFGNVIGSSPALQEQFSTSGLGKLLFGGGSTSPQEALPASLTLIQQLALRLGTAMQDDFPDQARLATVVEILRFFKMHWNQAVNLSQSQQFKQFIALTKKTPN